jgi:hypothetical protein
MSHTLFAVFPKSGTGLLHAVRGVKHHIPMFDERGEWRTEADYLERVRDCDQCTGHIPYSYDLHHALKRDGYRVVFIFRNLRDVVCSLVRYVARKEGTELNVITRHGLRLSRAQDPILEAIDVVAEWWQRFAGWMEHADALYTYRELRGAALLVGREDDSFTFANGNINDWRREFKPHHIRAAEKLPDVLREYNLPGCYECERTRA